MREEKEMERHSSSSSSSSNSSSCFAVDVEKMLAGEIADSRWEAAQRNIYLVPEWLKGNNTQAYQPKLVSLGPFHHGDSNLKHMEEHKRRAVVQIVERSKMPLQDFLAAIDGDADKLMAAYGKDLDPKWRKDRQSFVEMMLADGCFLTEFMGRGVTRLGDYDPVFSMHSKNSLYPVIRSDMLLIENQLPLLVLNKITRTALRGCPVSGDAIDEETSLALLRFLGREREGRDIAAMSPSPHPLQLYHGSLTYSTEARGFYSREYKYEMMPSALEMHESAIKFSKSETSKLVDIDFKNGVLTMPEVVVDDSTKSLYLNLMAFERLNADAGDLVTAYVTFMDHMIVSAKDVAMLSSKGIVKNMLGCDEETAKLFNGTLSRGHLMGECRGLYNVQRNVKAYCSKRRHKWRAILIRTYFRNPWAIISFADAIILLIATLFQTVYTLLSYY